MLRKVKEHHRKKRKEVNKMKRAGIKPKEAKDPGIPNTWPFKEELIQQMKAQKEAEQAKERMLREQRRAEKQVGRCEEGRRWRKGRGRGE